MGSSVKIFLLRLSPVVPYAVSNYLCGLGGVPFGPFVAGTAVGTVPWVLLNVYLGSTGHELLMTGGEFNDLLAMVVDKASVTLGQRWVQQVAAAATVVLVASVARPMLAKGNDKGNN